MTRELRLTPRFKRSFRKFIQHNAILRSQVQAALDALCEDAFAPTLHTHRLQGELYHFYACSCGYDCRIVFRIEHDETTNEELHPACGHRHTRRRVLVAF